MSGGCFGAYPYFGFVAVEVAYVVEDPIEIGYGHFDGLVFNAGNERGFSGELIVSAVFRGQEVGPLLIDKGKSLTRFGRFYR